MEIGPILSTLRRHRTAAALIVIEVALTCAIVCNALFLIGQRLEQMRAPSGVAESELLRVQITGISRTANPMATTAEDLAALRSLPGVVSASTANQLPFGNSSWNSGINLAPDQATSTLTATTYFGGPALLQTLGLELVAGRDFEDSEFLDFGPQAFGEVGSAILTRSIARRLWPDQDPLGQVFYFGERPVRVVGVVAHLARPNRIGGASGAGYSVVLPIRTPYNVGGNYLIRTAPEQRDAVLKAAVARLLENNRARIVLDERTFESLRARYFRQDRAMAWLLAGVCVALLIVTALGIVGLASFWVAQRRRQIGVRRALGARRIDILRYFQIENFLLAGIGIFAGMVLAYGINAYLMEHYELPRLPWLFLPGGALALWLLGQLAVLGPALGAASVPPATATRPA